MLVVVETGGTALIESCTSGNVKIVEVLLAFGANIGVTDSDGVTALMSAAAAGNMEILHLLLEKGVEVDKLAHSGGSALMYAAGQGRLEACRLLLQAGGADAWGVVRATDTYKEQVAVAVANGGESRMGVLVLTWPKGYCVLSVNRA